MFDDLDPNEEKYSLQILKCFPEFNQVVGELQLLRTQGGHFEISMHLKQSPALSATDSKQLKTLQTFIFSLIK